MPLRIGIIGGAGHIPLITAGIEELGDATLCCVAKGCPEEPYEYIERKIEIPPGVKRYDDYREMLDREPLDIVGVSPFFHLHAEVCCEVLHRGIPVFCEKPLALTLESLDAVRKAREATNVPIGMMLNTRYQASFYTAHRLVQMGAIGIPTVGYSQKSYRRGTRPDFYKRRATFGGIIPWVGIHAIDWFRWVSGVEFAAVTGTHTKLHCPEYPELEDAATCVFELENGGSAVMSFDFLRPSGAPTHGDDRLRLLGDKGALEVKGSDSLELITAAGVEHVDLKTPLHGVFTDFALSVIDKEHRCLIKPDDAIQVSEIALKARDAADTRTRVTF